MSDFNFEAISIKEFTQTSLVTCSPDETMHNAAIKMAEGKCSAMLVTADDQIIGILTERDVVKSLASLMPNTTVADYASNNLVTLNENESLYLAKMIMLEKGLRHLGVTDHENNLIGIINLSDILAGFRNTYVEELKESLVHSVTSSGRNDEKFYQSMWEKIIADGNWHGEIWNRRKNGEIYPELLTISQVRDDGTNETSNYEAIFSDISQLKQEEDEIKRLAFYDSLTGLPNRYLLNDRLAQELACTCRTGKNGALLFIDLDHFKNINDALGHSVGDEILIEVAFRLKFGVRECDTVARVGGDEFVIILTELDGQIEVACSEARQIAEKLQQTICQAYSLTNQELYISSSIGIAIFSDNVDGPEDILMQADTAMSRAKTSGRNRLEFFQHSMQKVAMERMLMEKELRQALHENQLILYYQPQVDYQGNLMGAEALIRWNHPEKGFIPPDIFLPIAEECGLIQAVGSWMLEQACIQLRQWDKLQAHLSHLAINVSPRQFNHDEFMDILRRSVKKYQISPSRIMLEFTERLLMNDVDAAIDKIKKLKKLGYSFSMDDFGTGYSSLSYLKLLPVDQLKIDKSFVADITNDKNEAVFVGTIIAIAQNMGLSVVAEGVESEMELKFLTQSGCHCFQGYYFSKPLPADQFLEQWLNKVMH